MTTELMILTWTLILALVQIFAAAGARTQQFGMKWNAGARDEVLPPLTPLAGRLVRAQANLFETLPLFIAAVLMAHVAGKEGGLTTVGAWLYLAGRVVYVPLYAMGVPGVRSMVWGVALVGLLLILARLLGDRVTPAARLNAAIEVLDGVAAAKAPADQILKAWGKKHRFAGSGDRRAIAERVYQALRARGSLAWAMGAQDGRALVLGSLRQLDRLPIEEIDSLFRGEGYAPAPLTSAERKRLAAEPEAPPPEVAAGVPDFIARALQARFGETWAAEAEALVQPRAPVDMRVNALAGGVEGALRLLAHGNIEAERSPLSALGLRLPPQFAADIQKTRAYTTGWIEVQDEGSQIAAALAGAQPGWTVVDYCAGGGGKTLALAAQMKPQGAGRLIACDVNKRRLDAIPERLKRAGATAELRLTGADGQGTDDLIGLADLVLVDAPCSGSGTWRRRPEGAWRLTPDDVTRLAELQGKILARASALVRPGGRLAYVTCSILAEENDAVAAAFAAANPQFRPLPISEAAATPDLTDAGRARLAELAQAGHTVQLTPHRTGTDGFFIALFERSARA